MASDERRNYGGATALRKTRNADATRGMIAFNTEISVYRDIIVCDIITRDVSERIERRYRRNRESRHSIFREWKI